MTIRQPSILITDDDIQFRETLCGVLEPQGFRTLVAGDGEEALHIVRNDNVHVVLLDMHMPRMTGLETLRLVKRFKALLPCILLSARWDDGVREQAVRERAFSLLSKPVTRADITSAVKMAMRSTYGWV